MKVVLLALLLVLLGLVSVQAQWFDPEEKVETEHGSVLGMLYPIARTFRGIPYAAPPVGKSGRWKAPQPVKPWGIDPLFTHDFKPGCIQNCVDGVGLPTHGCPQVTSEDCLYLNVYTPRYLDENSNLPVMVYFPGGNFDKGSANLLYEGEFFAYQANVIVVSVTYRVGALGFLVAPGLNDGDVVNMGFLDQRQALQWVQNNIRNFGGNPNQVTIFGQSAGGRSVSSHLVSPLSDGLFQRAIIQSDPMQIVLTTKTEALALAERFGEAVGCDMSDTACLYQLDPAEIIYGQEEAVKFVDISKPISAFMQIVPTIDGVDIPDQPLRMVAEGRAQKKPILMGVVHEETVVYIYSAWKTPVDIVSYRALMTAIFKGNSSTVMDYYPPDFTNPSDQREQMCLVGTHVTFACPNRFAARNLANQTTVYFYTFDHAWSFDGWGDNFSFCDGRVCHGAELPILFDTAQVVFDPTPAERELSRQMIGYFGNFANTGDPNVGPTTGLLNWPRYTRERDETMRLSTSPKIETGNLAYYCDMFDEIGYDPMKSKLVQRILLSGAVSEEDFRNDF